MELRTGNTRIAFITLMMLCCCSAESFAQLTSGRVVYINDFLQGDQLELSLIKGINDLPLAFELGMAVTPKFDGTSTKVGFDSISSRDK